jgi:hypothetical protein
MATPGESAARWQAHASASKMTSAQPTLVTLHLAILGAGEKRGKPRARIGASAAIRPATRTA